MRPRSHSGCDTNEDRAVSPFSLDANVNANASPINKKDCLHSDWDENTIQVWYVW